MKGRLLVISPHLDDAVFACGALLAAHPGATVLTVFAGHQPSGQSLTAWDRDCGFAQGDDVIALRRAEDAEALALLHATPLWLEFLDAQYGATPALDVVASALRFHITRIEPDTLLFPLGLFHSDHVLTHRAALQVVGDLRCGCYAYEDALYRQLDRLLDERLSLLRQEGWRATRCEQPADERCMTLKRRAVRCYGSQLKGLSTPGRPGDADTERPEIHWRIERDERP